MKFILSADLHISEEEKDYSLAVLNEIIDISRREKCDALFFAGDVFNSRADVEKLRNEFRAALEDLPSDCEVYFLPGNHEELRAGPGGAQTLDNFDFGRAELLSRKPWSLRTLNSEAELLALPFQKDYSGYRGWEVPPKKKPLRIVLAHGTVPGITYTGPDEEAQDSVLDADLFACMNADLAALGHLHGGFRIQRGETLIVYPGSARVWREGEKGPRKVLRGVTEAASLRLEEIPLRAAGEYRVIPVYAAPDGSLRIAEKETEQWAAADWLRFEVSGVVEDESSLADAFNRMAAGFEKKYRRVTVSKDKVSVLAGIVSHPLALQFIRKWEKEAEQYKDEDPEVYNLARIRGLDVIKKILEGRK
jgi:DNA repair exonuclease SbcCD nuclease subunit